MLHKQHKEVVIDINRWFSSMCVALVFFSVLFFTFHFIYNLHLRFRCMISRWMPCGCSHEFPKINSIGLPAI